MGTTIYPTVPVEGQGAQLKAEPWPVDEQTIRIDEMFARQLDTAFSSGVRALLYASEAGIAAQSGEGRPPRSQDIDGIVNSEVSGLEVGDPNDPFNLFPQKSVDPTASAVYRPGDQNTTDGLFLPVQAVGDNNRQGRAAELTVLEEIKKLLPEPKTATHIRLYVEGGPRYMVGDIVFSPNGTSLIVLEVKSGMAELTPMQIRAGRAMLQWTLDDLSRESGVSVSSIRRIEGEGERSTRPTSLSAIRQALERHGLIFSDGNGISMGPA